MAWILQHNSNILKKEENTKILMIKYIPGQTLFFYLCLVLVPASAMGFDPYEEASQKRNMFRLSASGSAENRTYLKNNSGPLVMT